MTSHLEARTENENPPAEEEPLSRLHNIWKNFLLEHEQEKLFFVKFLITVLYLSEELFSVMYPESIE